MQDPDPKDWQPDPKQAIIERLTKNYRRRGLTPDVEANWQRFQRRRTARRRRRLVLTGLVIALLLALAGYLWSLKGSAEVPTSDSPQAYRSVAVKEEWRLPDGSFLTAREGTELRYWEVGDTLRRISFTGEAYFEIAEQPGQPLVITTGRSAVRVLGTAFNLRALPEENTEEVEVNEGKVAFRALINDATIRVSSGERGIFKPQGRMELIRSSHNHAASWRTRRLEARGLAIRDLAIYLNRYSALQIKVAEGAQDCPVTGRLYFDKKDSLIQTLETATGAKIEHIGKNKILLKGLNCE